MKKVMIVVAILALASLVNASDIVANFDGGNGETSVDQYKGIAGDGWTSAWVESYHEPESALSAGVQNANPLNGGGNYLQTTLSATTGGWTNNMQGGVCRSYAVADDTAPATISMDIRLDSAVGWGDGAEPDDPENERLDKVAIFGNTAGPIHGTSSSNTYSIHAEGVTGTWWIQNGSGWNDAYDSGFAANFGDVYNIAIAARPGANGDGRGLFDVTITNLTSGGSHTALNNVWRNSGGVLGDTLCVTGRVSSDDEFVTYSVDNITIVPEPATMLLLGIGGFALLRKRS